MFSKLDAASDESFKSLPNPAAIAVGPSNAAILATGESITLNADRPEDARLENAFLTSASPFFTAAPSNRKIIFDETAMVRSQI